MNLSPHFTLEELTHSEIAVRKGIANTPDADTVENLKVLASSLERVRHVLGSPIIVSSGYRSPKVNSTVGGSPTSSHLFGYAADFICPGFGTPREICEAIRASGIDYDQIIEEGTWVHFSADPRMRRIALQAKFSGGKASYAPLT